MIPGPGYASRRYTIGKVRAAAGPAAAEAVSELPTPAKASMSSPDIRAAHRPIMLRSFVFVTRRPIVGRSNPGDDLPQIGIALDHRAHRRHGSHDVLDSLPVIAGRLQLLRPQQ